MHRRIVLSDPGIDDSRNELLWNPGRPRLIDAVLTLEIDGRVIDEVRSYTALRSVAVDGHHFVLNGRPYPLRLVLDQGYWPETGLTAPDDAALRLDVELAKAMGFNGVRKHQKIEDPRYLYWADRLGLLVWTEMPSAYRFTTLSIQRTTREWMDVIERDYSHPCVIAWVPFNESWGVPNLPNSPAERHYVRGLFHLTKTFDPTRPVVGNDGWESVATDIIGIHDYDPEPSRLAKRYRTDEVVPRLFRRERPGGRSLVLEGKRHADQPLGTERVWWHHLFRRCGDVGVCASGFIVGSRGPISHVARNGSFSWTLRWLLLHAVRRHLSGSKRPAHCGSATEDPVGGHLCCDNWRNGPERHAAYH